MGDSEDTTSQPDADELDFDDPEDDFEDIVIEDDPDTTSSEDAGYGAGDDQGEELTVEEEDEQTKDIIKRLRRQLKECVAQKQEYLDGWQRAKADMVNTKKEFAKERERMKSRTIEEVVAEILPVLDSFQMAFANEEKWNEVDPQWRSGVEHIHSQLLGALKSYGLEAIKPEEGDTFDPQLHTSVDTVETDDTAMDDTVATCEKTGYRIDDRIIRSANVVVNKVT